MGAASSRDFRVPCAILGSGNIATDLLYKLLRSSILEPTAMIGIDPASDGLARAGREGLATSPEGVQWLQERATDFRLVFEATSARVHQKHAPILRELSLQTIDLTPAAIGPPVVPTVNIETHLHEWNVNMVTCGGQATLPIVAAVTAEAEVPYAEIISTISSRSAGPGTRQNIDEFTRVTGDSLIEIGGARSGKAIIILNPAEPPMIMRNTVYCGLSESSDRESVRRSIEAMVERVQSFVPGYRLKSAPVFDDGPYETTAGSIAARVVVFLEVEGSSDYLPSYAGNLDIMTAAAVRTGEAMVLASREVTS